MSDRKTFNEINIKSILCIHAHKESIKHISIPKDLKPEIILSTSNERTVKLFNYENGEYIDFDLKRKPLKAPKVSEVPPMPVIIRILGAFLCIPALFLFQIHWVTTPVRSQRTDSTFPTD
jgi:hypothetical protein